MSPCRLPVRLPDRQFSSVPPLLCQGWRTIAAVGSLIGGMVFSGVNPAPALAQVSGFEDIRGHWSQLCVQQLAQGNLVSAFRDANFRPDQPLSRELYADLLSRAFPNLPEVQPNPQFDDVPPFDSQFEKIYQTYRQGFFAGVTPRRFGPTLPVSREDFFVVLANGLGYEASTNPLETLRTTYDDGLTVSSRAQNAVAAATERGIVVNVPNVRTFRPQDLITRAEAAAVFCQLRQTDRSPSWVPPQYVVELPSLLQPQTLTRRTTAGSLPVVAELRYQKENYTYQDVQLSLYRDDKLILQHQIPVDGGFIRNLGLQTIDLDGDSEPEILLSFFAGPQRCCSYSLIYSYLPRRQEYGLTQQPWGYEDYVLVDLDQDGLPDLKSRDSRFTLRFAESIGDAIAPLQIWNYRQGQLFDVTRLHPTFVKADAVQLWNLYQARQRQSPDLTSPALKPVLAAYAASKFILGEGADGFYRTEGGYGGGDRAQYLQDLRTFLRGTGYANH
jgi:S-layer homology domain